jgi:hypothetical protein
MFASHILPHHFAGSILLFYGLLALCFTTRKPPQSVKLTHMDVELAYCTQEELEYCLVLLLTHAHTMTLTDDETRRYFEVTQELLRRPSPRKEN